MTAIRRALAAGYESLSAWSDLLDAINVFPVADRDTGANLRISLAPLRDCPDDIGETRNLLAQCAVGNSGNIAAAFFREFCRAEQNIELAAQAARGRDKAWQALAKPRTGTMLDVFDCLAATLGKAADSRQIYDFLREDMHQAVLATSGLLADLKEAGVVDAGALGMYLFFDGFFRKLSGKTAEPVAIPELFAGKLVISSTFQAKPTDSFCVNATLQALQNREGTEQFLAGLGESVVMLQAESGLKVHIHTGDRELLRNRLAELGNVVDWSDEAIENGPAVDPGLQQAIHIMTDAAGSLTRDMARQHGITLLDSYILAGGTGRPETLCAPADIYALMRGGVKLGTAQASTSARHQHYRSVCQQYGRTLYLCVGSAYTGNYEVARHWQEEKDTAGLLTVLDTGAASGRLGLIALLSARFAAKAADANKVIEYSKRLITDCREYVFIDELQYLVAGGRVSKARGFFADLLHMKPVISPTPEGVRKAGVVRDRKGQLAFALEKLDAASTGTAPVILLQYSDNEDWVRQAVKPRIEELLPKAEIMLAPLSLTSGVHMGPGTWSLAWAGES